MYIAVNNLPSIYIWYLFLPLFEGNGLGSEGGKAIADALKLNTSLTQLGIACMYNN